MILRLHEAAGDRKMVEKAKSFITVTFLFLGGATIKKVMEETGCHIHFPDSNRSGSNEKSNQVSIAGEPAGVESARRKIRALLPIVLSFDLPKNGVARPNPDINSPPIQRLIQTYNISVQFRPRPRGQPTLVPVRGTQQNVTGLKDGITCLMQHLTGQIGATLPVTCNLEVAPQHQQVLSKAIRHIQNQTGARITLNGANEINCTQNGLQNAQNGARRTPSPITITGERSIFSAEQSHKTKFNLQAVGILNSK